MKELAKEYDLFQLTGRMLRKYYGEAAAGTNLMLTKLDLAKVFCDSESVNCALRLLADTTAAPTRLYPGRKKASES